MATTAIQLDFSYDDPDTLENLLYEITSRYQLHYRVVTYTGPAGGWPLIEFVGTPEELKLFLVEYTGGDEEEAEWFFGEHAYELEPIR